MSKRCNSSSPSGLTWDEDLLEVFKTDFQLRLLWGSRGASVNQSDRYNKFNLILTALSRKLEPPPKTQTLIWLQPEQKLWYQMHFGLQSSIRRTGNKEKKRSKLWRGRKLISEWWRGYTSKSSYRDSAAEPDVGSWLGSFYSSLKASISLNDS